MVRALLLVLLAGCGDEQSAVVDAAPPKPPEPTRVDAGLAGAPVVRRSRALMSTVYEFVIAEPDSPQLQVAVDRAFAEIARLEAVLSEWRPDSEVSKVNAAAGKAPVHVSADVLANVREGLRASVESEGAFDLSWAALRGLWDFRSPSPRVPAAAQVAERAKLVDYRKIRVDEAASTVFLEQPGMAIGLGGIAKGYALDRAMEIFYAAGIRNFVLYAGGQVLASGRRGARPWRVGIQDPRGEGFFARFEMASGSAATSGDYEHSFIVGGVRYHHIIDTWRRSAKRGWPARGLVSVTVLAPTGIRADALDNAILVLGAERGLALARRVGVEAVLVDDRMRVFATDGIRATLVARPLAAPTGP